MKLLLPAAFENRMKEMLRDEWEEFLRCYSEDRYQALRLNTLKVSDHPDTLSLLNASGMGEKQEFPPVSWAKAGYYYSEDFRPGRHPFHEMGLYYIQEPSAMSAAAVLAPEPGMRVLDLCAAPGGKTTQLASCMKQKGLLIANEINPQRARILAQNVERMGIRNCLVVNEDSDTLRMHFPSYFHKILVDAPCSGEGMFRKNPMAMNEWSPDNVKLCANRQAEILDNAAQMLLPGGEIVYSTCTFAVEENEESIEHFLAKHPDFTCVKTWRLWPHKLHGEGHFVAKLIKEGNLPSYDLPEAEEGLMINLPTGKASAGKNTAKATGVKNAGVKNGKGKVKKGSPSSGLDSEKLALLTEFVSRTLTEDASFQIDGSRLSLFGEHLYLLPSNAPSCHGLHVLRAGLELGEFKKNRFEPSHALALTLRPSDCQSAADLSVTDSRAEAYYRGESLLLSDGDFPEGKASDKGWCLLCFDGFSAGWGKLTGQTLKNHYPKGLRYDYSID